MERTLKTQIPLIIAIFVIVTTPTPVLAQAVETPTQYQEALRTLNLDSENHPRSYNNQMTVGDSLTKKGYRQQAIDLYTEMLEERPGNADILLKRGLLFSWEKKYQLAESDLQSVIENHPTYGGAYRALTNVYRWTDRDQQALETLNQWIKNSPDLAEPHLLKAEVLTDMGQRKQAQTAIERAESLGASESDANEARARLYRPDRSDQFKWSVSLKYSVTTLSKGFSDWQQPEIRIKRSLEKGSIAVGSQRVNRFDDWNSSIYVDVYYDLWEDAYGNFRYLTSPQHDFLPRHDFLGEIYQSLGGGWEVSGGYRRMTFNSTETDILMGSLTKYIGDWYLNGRLSASENNRNKEGFSQKLTIRNYYRGNADDFWEVSAGRGEDQIVTDAPATSETLDSESLGFQWQRFWTNNWGTKLGFSYKAPEVDALRRNFSFEVEHRW